MPFLSIIMNSLGSGHERWHKIANEMNRYLLRGKVWKNKKYFFDGADYQAFFTGNFRNFLYSRTFMLSGLLNVGLWKYIQEAQLSSNDEPLQ